MACIGCSSSFAQSAALSVVDESWSYREGAPQDVESLAQTADGYLWLGGVNGLDRFDGIRFEHYRPLSGEGLLSPNITALLAAKSGGLWIGYTYGGFSHVKDGKVINYGGELAASTGTITDLAEGRDGVIWAATTTGVWRFESARWEHLGAEWNAPLERISRIAFDAAGVLWVATDDSFSAHLFHLLPDHRNFQADDRSLPFKGFTVDADGIVVTRSRSEPPQARSRNDSGNELRYPLMLKEGQIIIDRRHGVWITGHTSHDRIRHLPPAGNLDQELSSPLAAQGEDFPINPQFRARLVDREGNIWFVGPDAVHRFFYSPVNRQPLAKNTAPWPLALAADKGGDLWILSALYAQHLSRGVIDRVRQVDGTLVNLAYAAPDETFWFATDRDLWHVVGGDWIHVKLPPTVADQVYFLQTITQDPKGGVWISLGRHGLYRVMDGSWTAYGGHDDLPKHGVVIEFTDRAGRVWFGCTQNVVAMLDGDRVEVFGPGQGVAVGNVTAIYGRGAGVWIGGATGLQRFDNGRFQSITAVENEWLRAITGIVETADGDLWVHGLSGILRIPSTEIAAALKDPTHHVTGMHLTRRHGLLGNPSAVRPLRSLIEGSDGRLWVASNGGLVWLDPSVRFENASPPPVSLESVAADGKFYPSRTPLQFPAHTPDVQFTYAAVSLSNPEAVLYRYKLDGIDQQWQDTREARTVTYRNLSPGSYHFRVQARDINGSWSAQAATATFTILPAVYQTGWFLALCIAAGVALLYCLYVLRLRYMAREFNLTIAARVGERTRIARDLHDTLLQSLHGLMFQFQAARNVLPDNPTKAMRTLDDAISATEQAIAESRDTISDLRPQLTAQADLAQLLDAAGHEMSAQQDRHRDGPAFRVIVEGEARPLWPSTQDEVFRIARELILNAFRHADASMIEVEIRYDKKRFRLRVRDNGKGMDAKILQERSPPGHWGLPGVRERAQRIESRLDFWSKAGAGTEAELIIPGSIAYKTARDPMRFKSFRTEECRDQPP